MRYPASEKLEIIRLVEGSHHRLRKAATARPGALGCAEQEIVAITGHRTSKEVTRDTRAASQKAHTESALRRLSGEQS